MLSKFLFMVSSLLVLKEFLACCTTMLSIELTSSSWLTIAVVSSAVIIEEAWNSSSAVVTGFLIARPPYLYGLEEPELFFQCLKFLDPTEMESMSYGIFQWSKVFTNIWNCPLKVPPSTTESFSICCHRCLGFIPCAKFMRRHEDSSYSNHGRKTIVVKFVEEMRKVRPVRHLLKIHENS